VINVVPPASAPKLKTSVAASFEKGFIVISPLGCEEVAAYTT
jgi:hypothetical protein